jgi:trichothecene 3-O-acetyltransferase
MDKPRMAKDLSEYQDVLGQLITLNLYTPICLCFPLQDASSQSQIIDTLIKGLERLSVSFPWLAGQVISEGVAEGNTRLSKIIPLDKTSRLIVKDLTHDAAVPSMDALRKANFPFSMLDGAVLTPLKGLPTSYEEDPAPVFFLQANFINGGLLLNFAGEHSTMDGHGLGQIIRIFSKACHNEPFTDEELLQGNRARDNVIPLFDQTTYKPGPELDHLLVKPSATSPPASNNLPPKCIWAYFHFPSSSLSKLKSIASPSSSISENPTAPYTTTNDALSAFIWQCTSRIRSSRLPPQTTSTFARAVDVRSCLSIPPSYLGNMSNHTYNTLPLSSVPLTSLGSLASSLRLALNPSDLGLGIRSLATYISLTPDKASVSYGANMDLSTDIFFSSWAKLACYNLDFNLGLGFPESVRRPRYDVVEGLMHLMPMDRSGAIDAAICLRDEDLEGLRGDREFGEYAEWIG